MRIRRRGTAKGCREGDNAIEGQRGTKRREIVDVKATKGKRWRGGNNY